MPPPQQATLGRHDPNGRSRRPDVGSKDLELGLAEAPQTRGKESPFLVCRITLEDAAERDHPLGKGPDCRGRFREGAAAPASS